ncbi:MAG: hypothetical protein V7637_2053 [Mycobacteriales bacterium]
MRNDGVREGGLVLVTGAAGGAQGATGRQVAELLRARGVPVRAFVRTLDERAERLRGAGAEVVTGDLRDIAQVEPALDGVDRVFFTYPVLDGLLDATAVVAAAARSAGVRRLVEVSQLSPRPGALSPRTRQHWVSEQVFDWAGVGAVHLRATVFYENIRALVAVGAAGGELAVPLGDDRNTIQLVAAGDVARVAAALLADPARPAEPFYRLVGAVPTIGELVAEFGAALGIPLRYVDIDPQEWRDRALARGGSAHTVEHLSRLWQAIGNAANRDGATFHVTDAIETVTGAPPETLREFLRANREALLAGSR